MWGMSLPNPGRRLFKDVVWVRYLFKGEWKQCSHYSLNIFIDALIFVALRLAEHLVSERPRVPTDQ
jgi:hypothetical protein